MIRSGEFQISKNFRINREEFRTLKTKEKMPFLTTVKPYTLKSMPVTTINKGMFGLADFVDEYNKIELFIKRSPDG